MDDVIDDDMDDDMDDVTWTRCHPPLPDFPPLHYPHLAPQTSPQVLYPPAVQNISNQIYIKIIRTNEQILHSIKRLKMYSLLTKKSNIFFFKWKKCFYINSSK